MSTHRIGLAQGTAIYVGAILGAGILALPALAAATAGPASLVAWVALLLFCVPVAFTFAALGARYPDSGGVATFVAKAFGQRASGAVGYWFYFALPAGAPATAYVGGQYVAHTLGAGQTAALLVAAVLLLAAFGSNMVGLRLSGRLQLLLVGLLAVLLLVAVVTSLPQASTDNLTPFAPHGWGAVAQAASLLFFTFAGWEAVTHLSGEFRDPARDLRRVTITTLIVIGVLYLGLALTCVLVLGPELARTEAPLTLLLQAGTGSAASMVTAVMAMILTFGTMNAFLAGASRLGAALARDGVLPAPLAKGHRPGEVPRRSLALLFLLSALVCTFALTTGTELAHVMLAAAACFIAVTVAGLAAGVRLLPRFSAVWWGALVATVAMTVLLVFSGWFLLLPLVLGALAVGWSRAASGRRRVVPVNPPAAAEPATSPAGTTSGPATVPAAANTVASTPATVTEPAG
ncbi:APC family permease [Streptomyces spiramenti]|uniref:Amino acid permease n=1 Tax=Streptomyces spiramenti TaxID=2720606 RepID=A0ABX1AG31_9ACTN|nr:amino acid permease [Streptomyces spiramenti]NJP66144.1 amino acid permease [Streptomyces spiramenti]